MATRSTQESDTNLPFVALQLLAPPVRLVSAALWKVMKERDVMQYGIVEEFVTSACETVPGLLTLRHQGKLALGLRARLILELCSKHPDPKVIANHMKRFQVPAAHSTASSSTVKKDVKIQKTVDTFHAFVQMLLTNPTERETFFKEEFPLDYGPKYDQELEKLLWEFLIRLDQLLPVPNLAQTVSWLSDAPPVLEECARAATQPQLLKILLQHQTCLGHLETAASLPPNMGDSILASLSLPPSGKMTSNQQTGSKALGQSTSSVALCPQVAHTQSFIKPVIGGISNDNVPFMILATKRLRSDETTSTNEENSESQQSKSNENVIFTGVKEKQALESGTGGQAGQLKSSGMKRKLDSDSSSDEEEDVLGKARRVKKRITSHCGNAVCRQTRNEKTRKETLVGDGAVLKAHLNELGFKKLQLPDDCFLCSVFVSCLNHQPKVMVQKLSLSDCKTQFQNPRSESPAKANKPKSANTQPQKTSTTGPSLDNKENNPTLPGSQRSSFRQKHNPESQDGPRENEDYVPDSEDEATKNFKERLFARRYSKTKLGSLVPTLREHWKPCSERRNLAGALAVNTDEKTSLTAPLLR